MSKMIPYALVNVLRKQIDVSMENYGIDCILYVPSNVDTIETYDVYQTPSDFTYSHYTAKVWIDWNPNVHRLRKLGVFSENETPMIARFGSYAYDTDGEKVDVVVIPNSYIRVPIQHVPKQIDTDEFELVDIQLEGMHDAVDVRMWKLVPRRVKL